MAFVLTPEEIDPSSPVGGKARALAELSQAELPIPPWFAILPAAFHASLAPETGAALEGARSAEEIRALVEDIRPSEAVMGEVRRLLSELAPATGEFALRSSAPEEDSAAHSFAGQLESFLFVTAADVENRIAAVWRSGFSERLAAYRQEAGLGMLPQPPAVVVQLMVDGQTSGVAFSADPVTGRRGVTVVTAVPGLGSALVSGEADADTWRVDRNGRIIETHVVQKRIAHRRDLAAPDGVSSQPVPEDQSERPALEETWVVRVADLARQAQRHFGRPQDIEWTLAGDQLYLLQSRPITGLTQTADPDSARAIWDNSNIIESYSGVTTPLTFSFARKAYEHVYREFCRIMRVPQETIESQSDMFCCMLGLIRGRVYYNLLNWYRLVAILPGYRVNRKFMEQMMGVRESLADAVADSVERPRTGQRLRDGVRLAATMWGLLLAYLNLGRRVQRFYRRLRDTLGEGRPDLSMLRADELVAQYRAIEQRLLTHWDAPILNDFATMFFHGLLRRLTRKWLGDTKETLQNDLLSAEPGMISSEPAQRVRRMAAVAARNPTLVETLCQGNRTAIARALRATPELDRQFQDYLELFGDRATEELKLESTTLYDDPTPLLRSVGQTAKTIGAGNGAPAADIDTRVRRDAEARVGDILSSRPFRRAIFAWVLSNTRTCVRNRENLRFERTRVFGRARLILLEIGRRLAALERLDDPRDIFYLELDEILAFVESRATTTDFKGLAAVRKSEFERYRAEPAPPDRFETHGSAYVGAGFLTQAPPPPPPGESLKGLGCCPGIVRGPVRVVRDPRTAVVSQGEIIVAERTDPGWVMIYPAAAGLLVERGSLLSHSAIVARELGLPTIVALPGLTRWLRDGETVELNGATGVVTRIGQTEGERQGGPHPASQRN
jgi:pyruvate,water dikinase